MVKKLHLNTLIGLPLTDGGPAQTCEAILSNMCANNLTTTLFAPVDRRSAVTTEVPVEVVVPRYVRSLPFKATQRLAMPIMERRFFEACKASQPDGVAFIWGNVSRKSADSLRDAGIFVMREKFNCAKAVSGRILQKAYRELDAEYAFPAEAYTCDIINVEFQALTSANLIYCPSPMVAESLIEIGIDPAKFAHSSYGFDPARLAGESNALSDIDGPTFIFVGFICVRKGAHILLGAWSHANIKGRLVLLGDIEPLIAERFAHVLAFDNVEHHRFSSDVGGFYRSADYFVFPSLEEGGPQVTYEAAACGLPSIVSRMGAGAIVRDDVEGVVEQSDDVEAWVALLRAADPTTESYRNQSHSAALRAQQFTWKRVGQQRREQLFERLA